MTLEKYELQFKYLLKIRKMPDWSYTLFYQMTMEMIW